MAYLVYPQNLPGLSASVTKTPRFSVEVQAHTSGGEARLAYWSEPLWDWTIAYDVLRDGFRYGRNFDELRQVAGLFLACGGSLQGFQFRDPDDNRVFQQSIGTTDGITSAFTLIRTYGANDSATGCEGSEALGFLDTTQPFNLYIDNSATPVSQSDPTYGYSLATAAPKQQQLVFNAAPAPGHALTADMSYLYYARFAADSQDFDKFMAQLWALKKVTLTSLRCGAGGSSLPSAVNAPGRSVSVTSSPFDVLASDGYVGITNQTGAALTIALPLYPAANQVVRLKDEGGNAGTYSWTVQWNGATAIAIASNGDFAGLRWNGAAWYQIQ
jgi:hypothetical protein